MELRYIKRGSRRIDIQAVGIVEQNTVERAVRPALKCARAGWACHGRGIARGINLSDPMVQGVRHIKVPRMIDCDITRLVEQSGCQWTVGITLGSTRQSGHD